MGGGHRGDYDDDFNGPAGGYPSRAIRGAPPRCAASGLFTRRQCGYNANCPAAGSINELELHHASIEDEEGHPQHRGSEKQPGYRDSIASAQDRQSDHWHRDQNHHQTNRPRPSATRPKALVT